MGRALLQSSGVCVSTWYQLIYKLLLSRQAVCAKIHFSSVIALFLSVARFHLHEARIPYFDVSSVFSN